LIKLKLKKNVNNINHAYDKDSYLRDEKKLYYMRNRSEIVEFRIVVALIVLFVLLIAAIVAIKLGGVKQASQFTLKQDSMNSKYLDNKSTSEASSGDEHSNESDEAAFDYSKSIICWGDSFSDNTANSTNFYTYYLSEELTQIAADVNSVFSSGLEGDSVLAIAAKQGGIPMQVQPFTIPATKTPVEISLKSSQGGSVLLQDKLNSGLNPCTIAGVKGTIEYHNGKLSFTRATAGNAVNVEIPETVVTNAMTNIKGYTAVYFFGGDCTKYKPAELVNMYKKMINFNGNEKYIIIGSVTGDEKTLTPYEEALAKEFKSHYINLRSYLTGDVFNDYDIKITSSDAKALKSGTVPPSFILNGKRMSDQGSEILAKVLFDKLVQLDLV
jgi:hypothetical protein